MTINEYLKERKLYQVISYENCDLLEVFSDLSKHILGFKIKIIQIKSNIIHPHIIKLDDEYFLIWDLYYWELFDEFVRQVIACCDGNSLEIIEKNIKLIIFDYLINRFSHIPAMALCIQANRIKLENNFEKNNMIIFTKEHYDRYIAGNYWSVGAQARYSVFFHEIFHVYYEIHPEIKSEDMNRLQILANTYLVQHPQFIIRGEDLSDKLEGGFSELFKDTKFAEEMAVDYRALIEMISIYRRIEDDKFDSVEFIKMVHESFRINEVFLCYMVNIENSWEAMYKSYQRVNSYEELLQLVMPQFDSAMKSALSRNTIIPDFLEKLSSIKYGIEKFTNLFWNEKIIELIDKSTQQFTSLNFILYVIEEGLRIINDEEYDPFEAKDILFQRMNNYYIR